MGWTSTVSHHSTDRAGFSACHAHTNAVVFFIGLLLLLALALTPARSEILNPLTIPKYVDPLVIPPAMPPTQKYDIIRNIKSDYYEIAVRQFKQQILPTRGWGLQGMQAFPKTTVWGYGSINHPGTFNYPAFTIEAKYNRPVKVKWINDLIDHSTGHYLPHLFAVDPTLHWANPPGGLAGRDTRPEFTATPGPYTGPVPIVTHVHGAHTNQESDGYPEAWYLPAANNIPTGYATTGTYYDQFKASSPNGSAWTPGSAVFTYPNDQRATTLWYHDHALGMTRLNVYAGTAGFYLLRGGLDDLVGGALPGPAPALDDPPQKKYYEIPIAIQDRVFNKDGSLFYPSSRAQFGDGIFGPYMPTSDVSPIWNPEFFGNTMVVNGRTWPYLSVEPRRYRFRFLNGCDSRFLILKMDEPTLNFWQIGSEGGFLPRPVKLSTLLMAPAERADVIVDFSAYAPGTVIKLLNIGPDEPFGGGTPNEDFPESDPRTTGQVMQFRVVPLTSYDRTSPPEQLRLPLIRPLSTASTVRKVSLNEMASMYPGFDGPAEAMLGTVDENGMGIMKMWGDQVTETPRKGVTEMWEIYNFTEDAHPIHLHQVQFEVVERQPMNGQPYNPEPWETGFKDTVIAYPDEITRIKVRYDIVGRFVWHCHILEHEDNEMMRPLQVVP